MLFSRSKRSKIITSSTKSLTFIARMNSNRILRKNLKQRILYY